MTKYELQFIRAIANDLMGAIREIDPDWAGHCPSGGSAKDYYRQRADTSLVQCNSPGVIMLHPTSTHPIGRKLEEMALALYQLSEGMEVLSPPREAYSLEEYLAAVVELTGQATLTASHRVVELEVPDA